MQSKCYFPAVRVTENKKGSFQATVVVKVCSIVSPLLQVMKKQPDNDSSIRLASYRNHLALLRSVSSWPPSVSLTLNIFTRPEPHYPMGGNLVSSIALSVTSDTRRKAIAEILGRHAVLLSLLNNYFPAIEFSSVLADNEMEGLLQPFSPYDVAGIGRRREELIVAQSESHGQGGQQIGFLAVEQSRSQKATADRNRISYLFPWVAKEDRDISLLAEAMLFNPSPLWLQIRIRPGKTPARVMDSLTSSLYCCEDILSGRTGVEFLLTAQLKATREAIAIRIQQLGEDSFFGSAFLCSTSSLDEALVKAVAGLISPGSVSAENQVIPLFGGTEVCNIEPDKFADPEFCFETEPFTPEEAACMFRIPHPEQPDVPGLPIRKFRTGLAAPALLQSGKRKGLLLGYNVHRAYRNEVRLSEDDRMRHCCILGQTGTGKSTLLSAMITQEIETGRGLCLIDPHGDLVEDVLLRYPAERIDDLVVVDFLDQDRIVPLNLLEWKSEEDRDLIIDDLYGWINQVYDLHQTGGPMFELYFRSFLRMMMGDKPRQNFVPTIGDFVQMFLDEDFRELCGRDVDDPQVHRMIRQATRAGGDASLNNMAPYVTSKLNVFALDKNLQRMVGQEQMAIDFVEVMESGKVMLVNLGRGRFGETVTSLLASQIVSRFKAAAMKRVNIPPEQRRDFFLYVDEFQYMTAGGFIPLLSEARKYRLGLVLANQYADQLETMRDLAGNSVLRAITGNVGTIINFRLGIRDAEMMEPVFHPEFNRHDLANLPLGHCYVSLKSGGDKPISLSMETVPEKTAARSGDVQRLRTVSMEKYAIPRDDAERNLERRRARIERLLE